MSVLSKIGKIAMALGPIAASFIPGVGGAISAGSKLAKIGKVAGSVAGGIAPVLGGMAKSGSEAKQNEALANSRYDANNLDRFKINQALPGNRLSTSLKAGQVSRLQPAKINWGGPGSVARGQNVNITGGYNDNLISPDTRTMADDITHKMMMDQLGGVQAPEISQYPQESGMDKAIGGGAAISSLLAPFLNRKKPGVANMPNVADATNVGSDWTA